MSRWFAALLLFSSFSAYAQDARGVDIQLFHPAADSRGLLTKNRSETLGNKDISFGLWLNGATNPLVINDQEVAEALLTANFHASFGILGFLEVGLNAPFTVANGPDADPLGGAPLAAQGIGDLELRLKGMILEQRKYGVGLGALLGASLPTGNEEFMSSGSATLAPQLIADTILLRRLKIAANVGALFRGQPGQVTDAAGLSVLTVQNQLYLGAGTSYSVVPERFDAVFEIQALTDLANPFGDSLNSPIEATTGIKIFLSRNSFFTLGAGFGINNLLGNDAYGAPGIRGFAGITFEPLIGDRDGDGLKDNDDKCPDDPEDFDGFEDSDGCPDPDNDGDGSLDIDDACPMVAGPMENRGCPVKAKPGDRDGDGILDNVDKCPDDPEDFDGFQDSDGCPELDNDGDGILDNDDFCPYEPEDKDQFEDEDGCPEKDNDKDGFLDADDKCPNKAEDFNEFEDEDGCPDKKPVIKIKPGELVLPEPIYFDYNKATIKKESFENLNLLAQVLNENPQITRLRVEGHTDADGKDDYNLKLSDNRAKSVVEYLVTKGGVDKNRLFGKGYGEGCPIDTNDTAEGKSNNRRSEFIILEETEDPNGVCRAQKTRP